MSKISSTKRVIEILKDLNDGKVLCIENLSYSYDSSTRSIRRDFELIKDIFGDILISPKRGCYQVITKTLLDNTLNPTELSTLKNILRLSEESNLNISKKLDNSIKKAIIKEDINPIYKFTNKPYEEIYLHKDKFKLLENAIKYKKEIKIVYNNDGVISIFYLHPHKIIFISENFYLASQTKELEYIKNRIALIESIEYTGNSFLYNHNLLEFIDSIQTPWAKFKENWKEKLIDVVLIIPKEQAKYFRLKKFLPSQTIIKEYSNGSIQVMYKVTSIYELSGLIKQWIPYVKVIKPRKLKKMFKDIAKKYYEDNIKEE